MSSFKLRVSCTLSSYIFQSKNIISWYPLFSVSALQFEGAFIPMCGNQFYHKDRKLIFHVLREMEICYLILTELGIFQVQFDVLSLEKIESLLVFSFCLCLM